MKQRFIGRNKHKPNYHNKCISLIIDSRFKAGHFTKCSLKNAHICNSDFVGVNLQKNNFRNAKISHCIFIHCNFTKSTFKDCTFESVYFCACKFSDCKDFYKIPKTMIYKNTLRFKKSINIENYVLINLAETKCEKNRILTISSKKINVWTIGILLNDFSETDLLQYFKYLKRNKQKKYKTLKDYKDSIEHFLKKI